MLYRMEDCIKVILEEHSTRWFSHQQSGPSVTLLIGSAFAGVYGLWAMFCMPELRVPFRLKVPFLPSTKEKTLNVIKLLEGRKGHLADLGSGDGCLVFAASSMGFQCTGFEINSILLAYLRSNAWWRGVPHTDVVKQVFRRWYVPGLTCGGAIGSYHSFSACYLLSNPTCISRNMGVLGEKLLKELPEDARVIVCCFPFPHWPHICTAGSGLNQVWAYDVHTARELSRTSTQNHRPEPASWSQVSGSFSVVTDQPHAAQKIEIFCSL